MSTLPLKKRGEPRLVGRDAGRHESVAAGADRRAAVKQGHGLGRPPVAAQRRQTGIGDTDQVAGDTAQQSARAAGTDQVVGA